MKRRFKQGRILFLALSAILLLAVKAPQEGFSKEARSIVEARTQILSHGDRYLDIVLQFPQAVIDTVDQEGEDFHRPTLPGWTVSDRLGEPAIPKKTFYVALPPGGGYQIDYSTEREDQLTGINIPEVSNVASLISWRGAGSSEAPVVIGEPYWIRYQRVLPVTVSLWRADGLSRSFHAIRQLRLTVSMEGGDAVSVGRHPVSSVGGAPGVSVLNPIEGRMWLAAPQKGLKSRTSNIFSLTANPWLKMKSAKRGIYRITHDAAAEAGFPVEEVDLSSLRCFAGDQLPMAQDLNVEVDSLPVAMKECAILVEDGGVIGVWEENDAVLFLANGPDGWYQDRGAENRGMEHYARHPLSSYGAYWLTWGGLFEGEPARMEMIEGDPAGAAAGETAGARLHLERNTFYEPRQRDPDATWEKFWYQQALSSVNNFEFEIYFNAPGAVEGAAARVRARYWGANYRDTNTLPDHVLVARLNDVLVDSVSWEAYDRKDIDRTVTGLKARQNRWHYYPPYLNDPSDPTRSDKSNLAWIDVDYLQALEAVDDSLEFFGPTEIGVHAFRLTGFSSSASPAIFNATDPWNPYQISGSLESSGGGLMITFADTSSGSTAPHYVALDLQDSATPMALETVNRQGDWIREMEGPVDAIIITYRGFVSAAEDLADYHRQHFPDRDDAVVVVKTTDEIFDEFSAGTMDVAAMRNFLEYAYVHWVDPANETRRPLYVTFLGDAYYDPRDYLREGGVLRVPIYLDYYDSAYEFDIYNPQYSSDDWFVLFDGPSDNGLDMITGRLPVRDLTQANALVQKAISYEQDAPLDWWKTRIGLLADDRCQGVESDNLGFAHLRQTEQIADSILPQCFHPDRIYLYEYGWPYDGGECRFPTKPEATEDLLSLIADGILVMNYTGHGSEGQLADERLLETSLVSALDNDDRPFLFVNASCSVGKHDIPGYGLGESLVLRSTGGAIAMFAASSVASSGSNAQLNRALFNHMYPDKCISAVRPVGEAARLSKLEQGSSANSKRYILLGDPLITLVSPRYKIDLEWIAAGDAGPDTLIRGAAVRLAGAVR
ncbi:MAG: hypothetical protein KJ927_15840, partial [Candidatus Eisenbacteria bacterium]|nr:hypothetical protein [Candidatus Eisenbacteria bacterium]